MLFHRRKTNETPLDLVHVTFFSFRETNFVAYGLVRHVSYASGFETFWRIKKEGGRMEDDIL